MRQTVLQSYRARVEAGELAADPGQARVAEALDRLAKALDRYRPAPARRRGLARLFSRHDGPEEAPRGLYIHGEVGRGKTMLMDLFFAAAPVKARRRVHFHAFMQDVHERIHRRRKTHGERSDDAIPAIAGELAGEATLLCFDEFQVGDITDAMILGRLFEALFGHGVVVVATSNTAPGRLYEGGLNRGLFLPFIALIEERLEIVSLDGETDYRQGRARGEPVYLVPAGEAATARLEDLWHRLSGGADGAPAELAVKGRTVPVPRAVDGLAWFSFRDLCETPLGPADYLAIARRFHTVFVRDIPRLKPGQRNEALRFITLIDALYDNGVRLVASAAAEPDGLYVLGDNAERFHRTASRLVEMQSAGYWEGALAADCS